ncbi:MAG: 2-dehydropantoate 2-reductase [Burkholderiales bacterium]|jgi:2-dehydropantoate 2-reductase|nr:2-dehydropantoate 2-reductase [Burkholderiales bacterium]
MKILVLGAGAIGGYFGGRLAEAGADVTFLVRERRAAQLERDGLVVKSPHGDIRRKVQIVREGEVKPEYDLVILACKAYDLDSAIASIKPAVGPTTFVLPLLNGLAHLERLDAAFGAGRVLGGTCYLAGTLTPEGEILQLTALNRIAFGKRPGNEPKSAVALMKLAAAFTKTQVDSQLASDILLEMWEKYALLATLAAMTCLMRGAVGDIIATDEGEALMEACLATCEDTAKAAGHEPRADRLAQARKMLTERGSTFTASMLRDVEAGLRTEADHIVGDMLKRASAAKVPCGILRAAYCHLQTYEARRQREQK